MRLRILLPIIAVAIVGAGILQSGCDKLVTEELTNEVYGTPRAEFTADHEFCCNPPCTVQFFEDTSWGRRQSRSWDFGDGGTDTSQSPIHVYDTSGSFTVTLTVNDTVTDWSDVEQKKRFIVIGQYLDSFYVDTTVGCPGLEVTFTPVWGGAIDTFIWDFGDGDSAIADTPVISHVYDSAGTYDVALRVGGDCGVGTYAKSQVVTIWDCPTVAFETSDTTDCIPLTLTFFDATSPFPDSVKWAFGDGRTSTDRNPTIDYQNAGVYDITLTAYLGDGYATLVQDSFLFVADTQATFTMSDAQECKSDFQQFQVRFENTTTEPYDSVQWTFGDGTIDKTLSPVHAYVNPGIYEVLLEVFNPCGTASMVDTVIYTDTIPDVPFVISPETGNVSTLFAFGDTTGAVVLDRRWSFGDNTSEPNAGITTTHSYSSEGTYICTLTVVNVCNTLQVIDTIVVTP